MAKPTPCRFCRPCRCTSSPPGRLPSKSGMLWSPRLDAGEQITPAIVSKMVRDAKQVMGRATRAENAMTHGRSEIPGTPRWEALAAAEEAARMVVAALGVRTRRLLELLAASDLILFGEKATAVLASP